MVSLEGEISTKGDAGKEIEEKNINLQQERDLFRQTAEALERAQAKSYEQWKKQVDERTAELETMRAECERLKQRGQSAGYLERRIAEMEQDRSKARELQDELMYARDELKSAQREIDAKATRIEELEYAVADRSEVAERLVSVTAERDRIADEIEKLKRRVTELDALVD